MKKRNLFLILVLLLLLLICLWYFILYCIPLELPDVATFIYDDPYNNNNNNDTHNNNIPKRIWTFWNSENIPPMITRCTNTWKKHCPDYSIIILTPANIHMYLSNADDVFKLPYTNTPQRLSDFVRLHVLYEHGGFWLDSSIILFDSLNVIFQDCRTEFVAYYLDKYTTEPKFPVIESWFFGCVKNSAFVKLWRDEFLRMTSYVSYIAYVDHVRTKGVRLQNIPYFACYYLTIHVAAQVVLQRHAYPLHRLTLKRAEDEPYRFLAKHNWNSKRGLQYLSTGIRDHTLQERIVKLRGCERKLMDHNSDFTKTL